jgi:hypothetical protein
LPISISISISFGALHFSKSHVYHTKNMRRILVPSPDCNQIILVLFLMLTERKRCILSLKLLAKSSNTMGNFLFVA